MKNNLKLKDCTKSIEMFAVWGVAWSYWSHILSVSISVSSTLGIKNSCYESSADNKMIHLCISIKWR